MRFQLPAPHASLLVRILVTAGTLVGLAVLVVFGMFALAILAVLGVAWLVWFRWKLHKLQRQAAAGQTADVGRAADPNIIEGEYTVVHEGRDHTP